jgi:hypothetical protein
LSEFCVGTGFPLGEWAALLAYYESDKRLHRSTKWA